MRRAGGAMMPAFAVLLLGKPEGGANADGEVVQGMSGEG